MDPELQSAVSEEELQGGAARGQGVTHVSATEPSKGAV